MWASTKQDTTSQSTSEKASPFEFFLTTSKLKDRLVESLDRTGEVVTQQATAHFRKTAEAATPSETTPPTESETAETGKENAFSTEKADKEVGGDTAASSPLPVAQAAAALKDRFNFAHERTREAVEKAKEFQSQSNQGQKIADWKQSINVNWKENEQKREEMLSSLKTGWGSVVNATMQAVETTREVVEKEQIRMSANLFNKGPYRRDASLPLDTEALCDAEVVYITDRLITMGHPAMQSPTDGDITSDRKLAAVSHLLHKRHHGRYMVWNLSELEYDYSVLDNQVMTFRFPGSPAPPLGLWLKIIMGMESWLKADARNVVVVHCLTGRGRTSTTLAAFLCWMGEAGFGLDDNEGGVFDANGALEYIAKCKRCNVDTLTIPSQRRYVTYFKNMMDSIKPSQPPLLLKRIIMSEAPKFGRCPRSRKSSTEESKKEQGEDGTTDDRQGKFGCSAYLQVFKGGQLVFTTAAARSYGQSKDDLPFCLPSDGPITFPVETVVQGDMLVRCRHLTRKGHRVSMFRAAIHTGYVPPKVLRLTKAQLDGACHDSRYVDDFFIDLIFEECDAAMASKHILSNPDEQAEDATGSADGGDNSSSAGTENGSSKASNISKGIQGKNIHNEAAARRMMGTIAGSETGNGDTGTAISYDSMLHRDSRFWDVISNKREENRQKKNQSVDVTNQSDLPEGVSQFYGPTIGRRREFERDLDGEQNTDGAAKGEGAAVEGAALQQKQQNPINAFSIGGELDFTEEGGGEGDGDGDGDGEGAKSEAPKSERIKVPKKDDLMDALMAIDDDVDGDNSKEYLGEDSMDDNDPEMEEIVFQAEDDDDGSYNNAAGDVKEEAVADAGGSAVVTHETNEASVPIQETGSTKTDTDQEGTGTPTLTSTSVSPVDDKNSTQDEPSKANSDDDGTKGKSLDIGTDEVLSTDDNAVDIAAESYDLAATNDTNSFDFDAEDEDLEDLENFLMKAKDK